jgi:hypothetical protein
VPLLDPAVIRDPVAAASGASPQRGDDFEVLARLVDWAERRTISTVWSCLAAHAAILCIDGIARQALPGKTSGVFECHRIGDHGIVQGTSPRWRMCILVTTGCQSHFWHRIAIAFVALPGGGPDLFIRQTQSLFVYFQGYPEHDPDTLAREYRRGIGRFLAGERDDYPEMPHGYFNKAAAAAWPHSGGARCASAVSTCCRAIRSSRAANRSAPHSKLRSAFIVYGWPLSRSRNVKSAAPSARFGSQQSDIVVAPPSRYG